MKIFVKILLILFTSFVLLVSINSVFKKGNEIFYRNDSERFKELKKDKPSYDIIFLGTSRTYAHNDPRIIDSITGLSSYNFGVSGANLLEMNLWFDIYLQHHQSPKLVVLDLYLNAFDIAKKPFFDSLWQKYPHSQKDSDVPGRPPTNQRASRCPRACFGWVWP